MVYAMRYYLLDTTYPKITIQALKYKRTDEMVADGMTKPLVEEIFYKFVIRDRILHHF